MAAATSSAVRYCWTDLHGLQTQSTVKRLHTGCNRNDQVATDVRLWLRGKMDLVIDLLVDLQKSLVVYPSKTSK
jgi:argininosuccinate lyase